ncbi:hypothetical protein Pint_30162 [Pistacia integerrima]|uniref:Uncharacterized protein n=1 Tax=Pistacia integerrima TaxID=434235 RepID=A0ACC0X1C6_9ROSI|nr:hypothetical protein Pint_30162 [Pistacia integerrima]
MNVGLKVMMEKEWWQVALARFGNTHAAVECGAEDDDGERMVASGIGEVWQHTHCHGIQDSGTVQGVESEFEDGDELCTNTDVKILLWNILFFIVIFISFLFIEL